MYLGNRGAAGGENTIAVYSIGQKTGELAMALGRDEKVDPYIYHVPVTAIVGDEAPKALAEVQEMDKQAIALLGQYGG